MARLELQNISKLYPGVRANDDICLSVEPGEIHAVLGENGAGKSTLMKIIYGMVQPDAGRMLWNGAPVHLRSPEHARKLGIAMVFQHFSLFESLSVVENVWLGLREKSRERVAAAIRELGRLYALEVEPERPVHGLSVGERQRVEILRALLSDPQLLILDEPTSVLAPQAIEGLFETLRRLRDRGCSILYVSHKLDEIRRLCNRCTVLRAGKVSGQVQNPATESVTSLSALMIGSAPVALEHREVSAGGVVLEVKNLSLEKQHDFGVSLSGISLRVRSGEVLGIAGVSGNGQSELMDALAGEDLRVTPGSIRLLDRDVSALGPAVRRQLGMRLVPEERLGRATVPSHSLAENMLLTRRDSLDRSPMVPRRAIRALAQGILERFGVKARSPDAVARSLSGGNLQKFVVGRELDAKPKVLLASQPTWGVDVGAAAQIRAELLALKNQGSALIVVSEDLDELFEICDSLVVMAKGRLSPSLPARDASPALLGEWMSGLWPETSATEREPQRGGGACSS
ncbi:MAG: ABC transporter ATP-binding protein [Myxococcota bacterium]